MTEPADAPSAADERILLARGELEVTGRILPASNLTFLADLTYGEESARCVYKPVTGERPLWDFPDGTLAAREVAAHLVSESLRWRVVPPTVLRDGPLGTGMVQLWREPDPEQDPVDVVAAGRLPQGYLHVLDAVDGDDRPVWLIHEDSVPLRRMAVFDAVVNNADRKGGHVLPMTDGHRYGVDHGVTFHIQDKLRTVLWGWAGQPLDPSDAEAVAQLVETLETSGSELVAGLSELLDREEIDEIRNRCRRLLQAGKMPLPSPGWPAIPWPAF